MIEIKLKEMLNKKGKSVYWLSKETGITPPTLYNIRDNKTDSIKFTVLESICTALDCEVGDLLNIKK